MNSISIIIIILILAILSNVLASIFLKKSNKTQYYFFISLFFYICCLLAVRQLFRLGDVGIINAIYKSLAMVSLALIDNLILGNKYTFYQYIGILLAASGAMMLSINKTIINNVLNYD